MTEQVNNAALGAFHREVGASRGILPSTLARWCIGHMAAPTSTIIRRVQGVKPEAPSQDALVAMIWGNLQTKVLGAPVVITVATLLHGGACA